MSGLLVARRCRDSGVEISECSSAFEKAVLRFQKIVRRCRARTEGGPQRPEASRPGRLLRHRGFRIATTPQAQSPTRLALAAGIQETFWRCLVDHLGQLPSRFTASCTPMLRPCPPSFSVWSAATNNPSRSGCAVKRLHFVLNQDSTRMCQVPVPMFRSGSGRSVPLSYGLGSIDAVGPPSGIGECSVLYAIGRDGSGESSGSRRLKRSRSPRRPIASWIWRPLCARPTR